MPKQLLLSFQVRKQVQKGLKPQRAGCRGPGCGVALGFPRLARGARQRFKKWVCQHSKRANTRNPVSCSGRLLLSIPTIRKR